jgi:FixJ family two-component response regulator
VTNGHALGNGANAAACSSRIVVVAHEEALRSAMCADLRLAGFCDLSFQHVNEVAYGPGDAVQCAVVILSGPGWKESMDMVRSLLHKDPHLPIVVVGERGGADTVLAAMRAGARDYLARPVRSGELADSIRGQIARVKHEHKPHVPSLPPVFASLSPNECEVLDGVIRGCSTKQIAAEIGRVEKTIEYHRKRIMEKLGVNTMVQAVRLATLHRWEWAGRGEGGSDGFALPRRHAGGP